MNWDAIAAVAELLAALGVIGSLIYLATQIRQNTDSVRMASHRGVADQFQRTNLAALEDPALAEILRRVLRDASSLTEQEQYRFELFLTSLFRTYEELFQLNAKGLVDSELWACREDAMLYWLSHENVRSWWEEERRITFVQGFREHVSRRLAEDSRNHS